jgi:hypothetical protein
MWIATVLLTLVAAVSMYLMLVAAGRASLRGPEIDRPMELFAVGFARFHFFWVTAIWPWVGAVVLSWWLAQRHAQHRTRSAVIAGVAALCTAGLVALSVRSVVIEVPRLYTEFASRQVQALRCLQTDLQSVEPQICNMPPPFVMRDTVLYARSIGATFAKYVQPLPDRPPIEPFYSMADPATGSLEFVNTETSGDAPKTTLTTHDDPQVIVHMSDVQSARGCRILEVRAAIDPAISDWAQLFYRRTGDTVWSEERKVAIAIASSAEVGAEVADVAFEIMSESGFEPTVRLDPVSGPQSVQLNSLEIRCRDHRP